MIQFVKNREIYESVIVDLIPKAKQFVWIATADIKDMHVSGGSKGFRPFLGVLSDLVKDGVAIRLLHAKEPGPRFREDFDKYPALLKGMERILCPRVHLKTVVVDGAAAFLGSANLTGAGMGAKSEHRRNFESGVVADDPDLIDAVMEQFDEIWMGACCDRCQRKEFCSDPIA
jgi:phosphatidylserine/phosphatidylglycerophosphate/cardiolipin synthase-like enzyme